VSGSDILVGKTKLEPPGGVGDGPAANARLDRRDISSPMRSNESGVVDRVMLSTNLEGQRFVKVRVRSVRTPECGDKFASRHGQKGTIGMLYRAEDMPFTVEGMVPDIIVNPHAIPSRMTVGHLIEALLGKYATLDGQTGNGTPFTAFDVRKVSDMLLAKGYQKSGNEVMFNGHTGIKFQDQVFLCPTFYQRLKHMVADKIHSRARGPLNMLTRQPMEGRAKEGGLRFGEMERVRMARRARAPAPSFLAPLLHRAHPPPLPAALFFFCARAGLHHRARHGAAHEGAHAAQQRPRARARVQQLRPNCLCQPHEPVV